MGATTHSIEINAPLQAVYHQWTQFTEFPRFMEGVEEVRQDGPKSLFWRARIAGKEKQWEAEVLEQVPDHKIVWQSVDGTPNSGEVTFEPLDIERTLVTLTMEYEPEGFLEKAGDLLGIPSGRVEGDLKRFRDLIEEKGTGIDGERDQIKPEEGSDFISEVTARQGIHGREETYPDTQDAEDLHPQAQPKGSSSIEVTQATSRVTPDRETMHLPVVAPIDAAELEGSQSRHVHGQVKERYPESAEEPSPVDKDLLGESNETQFYQDSESIAAPTQEQISRRAYELYLERGQVPGFELENWLQAEKELRKFRENR